MSTTTSATSNAISALGAGSGMDVKALANSLVDAERAPRKDIIDKKISKSEAGISGYSAIKFVFEGLKTSLMDIKDQSDFSSITPRNSQSAAFTVTASATASAGSHTVNVTSLAKAERKLTAGFTTTTTPINNGEAFNLNLSIHGGANQPISVAAGKDTPSGIVAAINEANLGVKAQLVNTGEAGAPYKIMVTGQTGALNDFELSAEPVAPATTLSAETSVLFNTRLQSAANGVVSVDGMNLTPSSNQLTDLIPGVTLDLYATTTGDASVDLIRDTSSVKTKVAALVKAYNDANTMLNTVSDAKSSVETYGGSLAGNSVVNSLRTQMRELIFPDMLDASNLNIVQMTDEVKNQTRFDQIYASTEYNEFVNLVYERVQFGTMTAFFLVFFIVGYLFYGSFFAAVGATSGSESDGQQFVLPIIFLLCFSLYAGYFALQNPESSLTTFFHYLPFTSPVVVMVKLAQGYAPEQSLQIYISLLILVIEYQQFNSNLNLNVLLPSKFHF
jgi:hypothetical protein